MKERDARHSAFPDCTRLNQGMPRPKTRVMVGGRSCGMSEAWVRGLPTEVGDIHGFERHEDWIVGFGVYARMRPLSDLMGGEVRGDGGARSDGDGRNPSTIYKNNLLVSRPFGSPQTAATPSGSDAPSFASDDPSLWVALDTEFTGGEGVEKDWRGHRSVVSWQLCFAAGDDLVELVIVPRTETPLALAHALNLVCELAGAPTWSYHGNGEDDKGGEDDKAEPISITLISHAGVVDLSTFRGSKHLLHFLVEHGGGMFNAKGYLLDITRDRSGNTHRKMDVRVRDTMSFTAQGTSLRMMGDDLAADGSLRKLEMSEGDYRDMGRVLAEEPERFCEYAIRDAEICWAYMARFLGTHDRAFGTTIPALSAKYLRDYLIGNEFLGDEEFFERTFRGARTVRRGLERSERSDRFYVSERKEPVNSRAADFTTYCRNAYKGGMNACTQPGYFECATYDYDLTSAYPLALGSLRDPDFFSPLAKTYEDADLDPEDPCLQDPYAPGAGYVTFEFPKGCYQPCIAVQCEGNLVFPRTSGGLNGVYVTMPEVVCALRLGARVHAMRLFVARPMADVGVLRGAFKSLIDARSAAAREHGKKSVQALALKLVCNTIYGKMAQALKPKRHRDLMSLEMDDLDASTVTSAYHAATGTALTRCVMAMAANQLHALGHRVLSTTTDGFISDAPEDVLRSIDLMGLRPRLAETRLFYTDGETDDIFEVKHRNLALLNLTTRGNVAPNVGGVFARAGLKGYPEREPDAHGEFRPTSRNRALFMAHALGRGVGDGNVHFEADQWASAYQMLSSDEDFHTFPSRRSVNLNFDLKRRPVLSTMADVEVPVPSVTDRDEGVAIDGTTATMATFDTEPFDTPEEFRAWRSWELGALVTADDFRALARSAETGERVPGRATRRDLVRYAFTAHRGGIAEIPELDVLVGSERLAWLDGFLADGERPFTANDWKNAFRQDRIHALPPYGTYAEVVEEMGGHPRRAMCA